ncbi:hypothetical protein [Oceanicola sp. S124]|uniref:hypothetical protein n=1 Tax=Oceanicola sp. S124 TaxID=1042378 RepID=UPI00025593A3|nr:hypothetical protein [Oceanicola sp. S124]
MKQFLLATALIAVSVAVFSGVEHHIPAFVAATTQPLLGTMSLFQTMVVDTQAIAASGDLVAAGKRITDLETTWDEAAPTAMPARPDGPAASGPVAQVSGIAVTEAGGRPIACEGMPGELREGMTAGRVPTGAKAQVSDLQSKAVERCIADDDRRADTFSAHALALLTLKGPST